MVETAAHLADPVFPRLPANQWVLSVSRRLRYHRQHDPAIETLARRIFLGVLAPNAPLQGQVTALAAPSRSSERTEEAPEEADAILRRAARYACALPLARIDEVFPLVCPRGGGEMRIIAFITDAAAVRDILTPLGTNRPPLPRLLNARAPTL